MVLVDTSVWIAFFRKKSSTTAKVLDTLLEEGDGPHFLLKIL
jgi:predicted nucleic acid-binding protein